MHQKRSNVFTRTLFLTQKTIWRSRCLLICWQKNSLSVNITLLMYSRKTLVFPCISTYQKSALPCRGTLYLVMLQLRKATYVVVSATIPASIGLLRRNMVYHRRNIKNCICTLRRQRTKKCLVLRPSIFYSFIDYTAVLPHTMSK